MKLNKTIMERITEHSKTIFMLHDSSELCSLGAGYILIRGQGWIKKFNSDLFLVHLSPALLSTAKNIRFCFDSSNVGFVLHDKTSIFYFFHILYAYVIYIYITYIYISFVLFRVERQEVLPDNNYHESIRTRN